MERVFIDTSAIIAFLDEKDLNHKKALKINDFRNKKVDIIISDYIFSESITLASKKINHKTAVTLGELILSSQLVQFVHLGNLIKDKAWEYFKRHIDKGYSFTDCTSFVFMQEKEIRYYLAFDKHFQQAGFNSYL